jgi:carbamoyl-phosphate synthase large subunit
VTRVLVTGAGGAAGVAVLRALTEAGHATVAADPDPLAAGRFLADTAVDVPYAGAPTFADAVVAAIGTHEVDAVVCTVAEEMPPLVAAQDRLTAAGAAVWCSPADAVEACIDKQRFAKVAQAAGLPVPASGPNAAGPWVVKPRFGRGSRDVHLVDTDDDLAAAMRRTPDPIVQTRCAGRELTVDALVDRDGRLAGAVPRWRLETKAGISTKGETFSDDRVTQLVAETVAAFGLRGAINVQAFVDDDADTPVQLVEVNPRFSGGLPLSLAAGADLVGEHLRGTLGEPIRPERLRHRDGVVMTRYLADVFIEPGSP